MNKFLQLHHFDVLHGDLFGLGVRHTLQLQAEHNVLKHRQPGEQRILLEHDTALDAGALNLFAVHINRAGSRLQQAGNDVQQGGFTAAGRTDHTDELVFLDFKVHAVQSDHLAIAAFVNLLHMVNFDLYTSLFSCHPVSFLSNVLMIFSDVMPMMPIRMM